MGVLGGGVTNSMSRCHLIDVNWKALKIFYWTQTTARRNIAYNIHYTHGLFLKRLKGFNLYLQRNRSDFLWSAKECSWFWFTPSRFQTVIIFADKRNEKLLKILSNNTIIRYCNTLSIWSNDKIKFCELNTKC